MMLSRRIPVAMRRTVVVFNLWSMNHLMMRIALEEETFVSLLVANVRKQS